MEKEKKIPRDLSGFIASVTNAEKNLEERYNDLAPTYKDDGPAYILKKELIGASCPNRINLHLEFDRNYRKISEEITGGHFITEEEYRS